MKTLAVITAVATLAFAVPAQAQFFSPYAPMNSGGLLGLQTGHISVLNGGILNGGVLNGGILNGSAVGNGVLSGILNGSGVGTFLNQGKLW